MPDSPVSDCPMPDSPASDCPVPDGPASARPIAAGRAGWITFQSWTSSFAPPTASVVPAGLNAIAYTAVLSRRNGLPRLTGRSGSVTFHSRTVPSAAASASKSRSGLSATDCTPLSDGPISRAAWECRRGVQQAGPGLRGHRDPVRGQAEPRRERRVLVAQFLAFDRHRQRGRLAALAAHRRPGLQRIAGQGGRQQQQHGQRSREAADAARTAARCSSRSGQRRVPNRLVDELAFHRAQPGPAARIGDPGAGHGEPPAAQQFALVAPGILPGAGPARRSAAG